MIKNEDLIDLADKLGLAGEGMGELMGAVSRPQSEIDAIIAAALTAATELEGVDTSLDISVTNSMIALSDIRSELQEASLDVGNAIPPSIKILELPGVTTAFIVDTTLDDNPNWVKEIKDTSWYNEPLASGEYIGEFASNELAISAGGVEGDFFLLLQPGRVEYREIFSVAGNQSRIIYRGNRREFPTRALIVGRNIPGNEEIAFVIHSLDEPNCPMWKAFMRSSTGIMGSGAFSQTRDIKMKNGVMVYGGNFGLAIFDFPKDKFEYYEFGGFRHGTTGTGRLYPFHEIQAGNNTRISVNQIAGDRVNNVDLMVDNATPYDPVTGLRRPTIYVATDQGNSVVHPDGETRSGTIIEDLNGVCVDKETGIYFTSGPFNVKYYPYMCGWTYSHPSEGDVELLDRGSFSKTAVLQNTDPTKKMIFNQASKLAIVQSDIAGIEYLCIEDNTKHTLYGQLGSEDFIPLTCPESTLFALGSTTANLSSHVNNVELFEDFLTDDLDNFIFLEPGLDNSAIYEVVNETLRVVNAEDGTQRAIARYTFPSQILGATYSITAHIDSFINSNLLVRVNEDQRTLNFNNPGFNEHTFVQTAPRHGLYINFGPTSAIAGLDTRLDWFSIKRVYPVQYGELKSMDLSGRVVMTPIEEGSTISASVTSSGPDGGYLTARDGRFGFTEDFTFVAWVQKSGTVTGDSRILQIIDSDNVLRFSLFWLLESRALRVRTIFENNVQTLTSPDVMALDNWVQVACIYRDGTLELWVDGELIEAAVLDPGPSWASNEITLRIGDDREASAARESKSALQRYMQRALSPTELNRIYSIEKHWFTENSNPLLLSDNVNGISYDEVNHRVVVSTDKGTTVHDAFSMTRVDEFVAETDEDLTVDDHVTNAANGGHIAIATSDKVIVNLPGVDLNKSLENRPVVIDQFTQKFVTDGASSSPIALAYVSEGEFKSFKFTTSVNEVSPASDTSESALFTGIVNVHRLPLGDVELIGVPTINVVHRSNTQISLSIEGNIGSQSVQLTGIGRPAKQLVWDTYIEPI